MKLRHSLMVGLALLAAPASAQSPAIAAAIGAGQVGERFDGYMGVVSGDSEILRRQVAAINIQRRNLYLQLGAQRNVTASLVGLTTACTLFRQLSVGEAYLLNDQVWRRRAQGQAAPVPEHCR